MKRKFSLFVAALAVMLSLQDTISAQKINYPESLDKYFSEADSLLSPSRVIRPMIGVLPSNEALSSIEQIVALGGIAALMPIEGQDYAQLRELAFSVDGFVVDENSSASSNAHLLRALLEQNVPIFGHSELLDVIAKSLRRSRASYTDVKEFMKRAILFKRAKHLMDRIVVLDSHCDLPENYDHGVSFIKKSRFSQFSVQKMQEGHMNTVCLVDFIKQRELDQQGLLTAQKKCFDVLEQLEQEIAACPKECDLARNPQDVYRIHNEGRIAALLCVENAYGIGGKLENIEKLAQHGVTYMTLCHMKNNNVCYSSSKTVYQTLGLTSFGKDVVREMNRCGILIDLSHTSPGTVMEVCKLSQAPVVCTHSGVASLYNHYRNLRDEELLAIKKNGGVVQIYLLASFMGSRQNRIIDVGVMADHIDYCVKLLGIDHVGVGTDMCGGGGGQDFFGANDAVNLTMELLSRGYSEGDISKIWGGNYLRVWGEALSYAKNQKK
ncbi:MAG: dipeptidase [Alistipes sp.]|nr:dipeptidase [Candidatus Alistipes equi]